jgi:pseudouridine synthase
MRINRYIAAATGVSRRNADKLIQGSKVFINDLPAQLTDHVTAIDRVVVNKKRLFLPLEYTTIMLNKPAGYVVSRDGQGSKIIYDLLPAEFQNLKPVGRLDKDSSGLLLLTDDGQLAHELTHPKFAKDKIYLVSLGSALSGPDFDAITKTGVDISDKTRRVLSETTRVPELSRRDAEDSLSDGEVPAGTLTSETELMRSSGRSGAVGMSGKPRLSKFRLEVGTSDHIAGEAHKTHDSCFAPNTKAWLATLHEGRNRQIRRTFANLGYTVKSLHRLRFGDYDLSYLDNEQFKKVSTS